ncbi:glycoside hydrolase family 15 protein (plasmid) [Streptomyces sp. AM 4-1-1]|uniref:glycoside hydrolase family 15 protein n=1 Tax=Streptomyces sp. AM 4-1-1 TaxID=3028710 RepID=UPI0023BA23FE|nr:glycoside hydrolase family 15 protein [Streptomyces sp. AM 4-1-1]WEH37878.1 glycoside hydrolase family 15 protein [Streptomyces sp. AM 4-1-1]
MSQHFPAALTAHARGQQPGPLPAGSILPAFPRPQQFPSARAAATRSVGRIEDQAFIGNMRTAAHVDRDGAITMLSPGRFDAPAVFARLLGSEEHGLWRVGPATEDRPAPVADRRRYLPGTLAVESTWITRDGTVQLTDFMPTAGQAPHVVRNVRGISGRVAMRSLLRARPDYGRHVPTVNADGHRASVDLEPGRLWLDTPAPTQTADGDLLTQFEVSEGETLSLNLTWSPDTDAPPPLPDATGLLKETVDFWQDWISQSTYTGPHRDAFERSLITLKALTYAPTGAIVAAATTSLPEEIGGIRNWDYRYCWLRDSAFIVETFLACGFIDEARAWVDWLRTAIGGCPELLQVMYGVGGERDLPETVLDWLPGHKGSAPVRTGNAAAKQLQVDVYGEVISALYDAQVRDPSLAPAVGTMITDLAACLENLWSEPDEGLWEVRGDRRHFVHSKVMAWVAYDRAVTLIDAGHAHGPVERWRGLREEIHAQVCLLGYDEQRNTFTQSYGSKELDAALLQMVTVGFLPSTDKRIIGTVEAVQRDLSIQGGFMLRYHTRGAVPGRDGLPGDEGAFLICSGWLITALARIGRVDEAEILLDGLLSTRNDLGLMSEEWDPHQQRQLGNVPQGFSHLALILAALAVHAARSGHALVAGTAR